ncbi:uncharacterized protein METZ01_LOCUS97065, partial [marine metagenome]
MSKGRLRFLGGTILLVAISMLAILGCSSSSDSDDSAAAAAPTAESLVPVSAQATVTAPMTQPAPATASKPVAKEAAGGIQMGGHLRYGGSTGFPPKWDHTQTSTWIALFHYGGRIWNGLLQFSPRDGVDIWNDMATGWDVSDDGLTYSFTIDENL